MSKANSVRDFVENVRAGSIRVEDFVAKFIEEAKSINDSYHYFSVFCEELALETAKELDKKIARSEAKGSLLGVPVSVKDCLWVKNVESASSSAILKGFKPFSHSEAVRRAVAEGAVPIGKTVQDEFGLGSFCVNVGRGFSIPKNPFDDEYCCGGSSGGAAGFARKISFPHVAISESTGGSIVNPASFCGVAGFCPSYGRISRYGLIDYANSLDKIGAIGKKIDDADLLVRAMTGKDVRDNTSVNFSDESCGVKTIGIVRQAFDLCEAQVKSEIMKAVDALPFEKKFVDLPVSFKFGISAYYVLASSEASTNLAKYSGMRYGASLPLEGDFNKYFTGVRSEFFGDEAKRRIVIGTFARMAGFRDAFYLRAAKVRTLIVNEFRQAFEGVDAIVYPTMPITAPRFDKISRLSPLEHYRMDVLTIPPNLAGLPHATVPVDLVNDLPVGLLAIGPLFNDSAVVEVCKHAER